jgi:molybdopterin-biosynthesis enzyme MoeA-like protein
MAGVPSVFRAMVASVLPALTGGAPVLSESLRVIRPEGEIAGPLGALAERFPDLSFGSYPFIKDGVFGANLVVRGTEAEALTEAVAALRATFPDAP